MNKYCLLSMFLCVSPFAHAAVEFDGNAQTEANDGAYELPSQPVKAQLDVSGDYTDDYSFTVGATPNVVVDAGNNNDALLNLTKTTTETPSALNNHISYTDIQPDSYLLHVDKAALEKRAYTVTSSASSLPESSTLALMMAGFGLVGFMSNRRRQLV